MVSEALGSHLLSCRNSCSIAGKYFGPFRAGRTNRFNIPSDMRMVISGWGLNLLIAKSFLAGTDNGIATWTWLETLDSPYQHQAGSKPASLAGRSPRAGFCTPIVTHHYHRDAWRRRHWDTTVKPCIAPTRNGP